MLTVSDATGREETGLAVDNDQVLEQVREVEATSAEWRRLQPVVETTVRANERRLASIEPSNPAWQREVLATTHLFDAPLTVETLYRSASHTSPVLYYFEAVRTVSRTDGLSISAKVSGWLRPDRGGRLSAFALTGSVYDEEGMWSLTPLAVVRLAGRVFWITNVSHYESSEYVIRDVSPTAVRRVLTAYGGGC